MIPFELSALPERLQEKIYPEPNTGCWLWGGCVSGGHWRGGHYGVIAIRGQNVYVHRLVYELLIAPIPNGLQVDHLCKTRICCNPAHLELVPPKVNINRGRRFNAEKTHCKRGHEFTPDNTYINPWNDSRHCRVCAREHMKIYMKTYRRKRGNDDVYTLIM